MPCWTLCYEQRRTRSWYDALLRSENDGNRGRGMNTMEKMELWVVYLMSVHRKPAGMNAVCEQSEWDAMDLARPGYHTLVRSGIASEAEAEKIARERAVLPAAAARLPSR